MIYSVTRWLSMSQQSTWHDMTWRDMTWHDVCRHGRLRVVSDGLQLLHLGDVIVRSHPVAQLSRSRDQQPAEMDVCPPGWKWRGEFWHQRALRARTELSARLFTVLQVSVSRRLCSQMNTNSHRNINRNRLRTISMAADTSSLCRFLRFFIFYHLITLPTADVLVYFWHKYSTEKWIYLSVCLWMSVIEVSHDAVKLSQTEADYVTLCADNDLQILPYSFKVIHSTYIIPTHCKHVLRFVGKTFTFIWISRTANFYAIFYIFSMRLGKLSDASERRRTRGYEG